VWDVHDLVQLSGRVEAEAVRARVALRARARRRQVERLAGGRVGDPDGAAAYVEEAEKAAAGSDHVNRCARRELGRDGPLLVEQEAVAWRRRAQGERTRPCASALPIGGWHRVRWAPELAASAVARSTQTGSGLAVCRGGIGVELHAWADLGSPAWNGLRLRSPEKKCMREFYTRSSRRSADHAPEMIISAVA